MGGAAAGVGAHLVVRGIHRLLRPDLRGPVVGVACASGMLGALVAGRLARHRLRPPPVLALVPAPPPAVCKPAALETAPDPERPSTPLERVLRRGPNGREHPWNEPGLPTQA
ncbi:hypothetical protein BHS07_33985 [Myxococcus xanthus]|uniref:Uncharacterized protein n=2 Tax=Myxococcus xanthus TaxID=34 RepID=A0AAE6G5S0_MYXXA|nr:hypothetical protein BHS09_33415 [Myxococcus xanthus]QDE78775.1 hypothetical protein BHS08_33435 [Myxococcus xanthus]QDE86142.1 hypothetical protein BHS07_33985 [Myxococcus xanthus]QDF00321.1 hypothetical protein BHS05_33275 [Myxococcus xanthus]QDF08096.1 hypothetical protein BHS04_33540 [Myxococcus xanthus]